MALLLPGNPRLPITVSNQKAGWNHRRSLWRRPANLEDRVLTNIQNLPYSRCRGQDYRGKVGWVEVGTFAVAGSPGVSRIQPLFLVARW